MQDKLRKILNIKVDAINKNIDNLNYLNGELDKNNENLDYIKDKISLFKNNEILNFDQISKDDFEKVLLMIEPNISDIFRSKTCSYEGIIYIIEGIRKSISLELTEEQNNAILSFIEGMRMKSLNLQDVIANLNESKNKLPETDLDVLSNTLENYEGIVSKLDNNLYLTEIDEIENALDFSEVSVEEKAEVLEYLLKYNAEIYSSKEEKEIKEEKKEETVELPEFHYEPFDINNEINIPETNTFEDNINFPINEEVQTTELNNNEEEMPSLEDIKINLDQTNQELELKNDEEQTKQINVLPPIKEPLPQQEDIDINIPSPIVEEKPVEVPVELNGTYEEIKSNDENHELNTVELEDIIKKIDAKLKEMDTEEVSEEKKEEPIQTETTTEEQVINTNYDYSNILTKYNLPELAIAGNNPYDVDSILTILDENKLLDDLKQNKNILETILNESSLNRFEELTTLINNNLLVKKNEFEYVLDIIIKTMPIILINDQAFNSFKSNLEFFKEHKINVINLFDNYREMLIMNHDILLENYNNIKLYGLELTNENVKYYLYNKNLISNLDSYLEAMGYEKGFLGKEEHFDGLEYIKKNPYKLNDINKNTLMKLRYVSENNQKIYGNKPGILSGEISNPKVDIITLSDDYKNTYFNGEYEFIDRSEYLNLKDEIDNLKEYNLTLDGNINRLDSSYKVSDLRYKIENVLISRIKTIRIYNYLKNKNLSLKNALIIALTYNTVLKLDEYEQIKTAIDKVVEGGN